MHATPTKPMEVVQMTAAELSRKEKFIEETLLRMIQKDVVSSEEWFILKMILEKQEVSEGFMEKTFQSLLEKSMIPLNMIKNMKDLIKGIHEHKSIDAEKVSD